MLLGTPPREYDPRNVPVFSRDASEDWTDWPRGEPFGWPAILQQQPESTPSKASSGSPAKRGESSRFRDARDGEIDVCQ